MRIALLILVAAWLCGACTCGGAGAPPAPALDRTPAPIPDGWIAELRIDGDTALDAIRAQVPEGDARAAMPARLTDLAEGWVALPASLADRVERGSPLRCVTLPHGDEEVVACAMRIDALPDTLATTPGGPRGAAWLEAGGSEGDVAIAIADRVIVASREREVVERALPYLAFAAIEEPAGEGAWVRLAPGYAAGSLRPMLDRAIDHSTREARERIAAERAAHDAPPMLGEPEGLVDALAPWARELAAYLPDLGAIELTLAPTPTGLALRARAEVREGSPLAAWIASVPEAGAPSSHPVGLDVIPSSAVLAWSSRSGEEARRAVAAEPIAAIAGARIDEAGRAAIEGALAEWAEARGPTSIGAIGVAGRPYLLLATDCGRAIDGGRIAAALEGEWARTVLETPLGCTDRTCPVVESVAREGACALAIRSPEDAELAAGALAGSAPLVAAPDVARELAEAPPDTMVRVVAIPERVPALIARVAGADAEGASRRGPVVLSIAREPDALVIDLRASTPALGALLRVLGPS